MSNWAIVPVKEISSSKSRLSTVLPDIDREKLVIDLFIRTLSVLQAVNSIQKTIVISRDSDMLDLATKSEALAIRENDNSDLNSAIQQATFDAISFGSTGILVLPADLPLLSVDDVNNMTDYEKLDKILMIVPDRHGIGTNALFVKPPGFLKYQFGVNSFVSHKREAQRMKAELFINHYPNVEFDIDSPDDLRRLSEMDFSLHNEEV